MSSSYSGAEELLVNLHDLGIEVEIIGDQLRFYGAKAALSPSLREQAAALKPQLLALLGRERAELSAGRTIPILPRPGQFPLSFAQQRLWFLNRLEPDLPVYNIPSIYRLTGDLNIQALEQSLQEIVRRHEVLRTNLIMGEDGPLQVIREGLRLDLPLIDLRHLPPAGREEAALQLARKEVNRHFDLERDLMLRALLIRVTDTSYYLVLSMHHVASDGWSIAVLWNELNALYCAFCTDDPSPLAPPAIQYADFAVWQRSWLHDEVLERELDYWHTQLSGLQHLDLPTDYPRPSINSYQGAAERFSIPATLTARLGVAARREGVTLYMLLLATFNAMLYRYTGQEDIAVGTLIANRNLRDIEELIGFFVNTLVMRTNLAENPSFRELLNRVREVSLDAYDHQDLPFEKLVEELQPERDLSRHPLFQVLFVLQTASPASWHLGELAVERVRATVNDTSKFDLMLNVSTGEDGLDGFFEYSTDLFDGLTIRRMIGHFLTLLEAAVENPDCRIGQLPLLTRSERNSILAMSEVSPCPLPGATVTRLFETQAADTPDAVALVHHGRQLTYQQLNERANRLARKLRELNVAPGVCVGLYMSRTVETIVSLLGILKAGGAYIPLEPSNPPARLIWILRDSKASYLLHELGEADLLEDVGLPALQIDVLEEQAAAFSSSNPEFSLQGEHLAYVMYTSGSTGQPKGVAMRHDALANLLAWHQTHPILGRAARTLQFSALSFDVSFQEIFSTWCTGGQIIMLDEAVRQDPHRVAEVLRMQEIERLFLPNVALQQLAPILAEDAGAYALETIVSAGEQLIVSEEIRRIAEVLDGFTLHNHYGPTESHVVSQYVLAGDPRDWPVLPPIGRAIAGARLYVLDKHLQLCPAGYPGELVIGGPVLARGYLHRPDLTQERFLADPYSDESDGRMYRTGDLVRRRRDGELEYLGRIDYQVKIRGFRVEPGEVEAVLARHPDIGEAVVVARDDQWGDRRLVAYIVPVNQNSDIEAALLQAYCSGQLPDYMVPSAYVMMEHIPLTANGKIDRMALPAPDAVIRLAGATYTAPRTAEEATIVDFWEEVLQSGPVGIYDNFFELGGHSLLATQVVNRISRTYEVEFALRLFFDKPTVAAIAAEVQELVARRDDWRPKL